MAYNLLTNGVYWGYNPLQSKNFPTYPWNIPKRPGILPVYVSEFLSFLGVRGSLGYLPRGMLGFEKFFVDVFKAAVFAFSEKPNMTMEDPPFEDVFPIEHGDFQISWVTLIIDS